MKKEQKRGKKEDNQGEAGIWMTTTIITEEERKGQRPFSGARAVPGALGVTNPDVDPVSPTMEDEGNLSSPAPSSANSLLKGGYGKLPLTVSSNVHPVGSRFFRQVAEKPRCGIVLPVGKGGCDRFILIGTDDGLYITDLLPSLGSAPLKTATSSSDAVVVPLWKGLGVLQLQVHIEETSIPQQKRQDGPRGVVIALVTSPGCTPELRMWSLTSLTNLAKWRCFNETSEPVVMPPLHPMPVKGAGASSEAKRSSRAFIKSLFASSETQAKDKGKGKSREVESSSSPIDSDYVVVSTSRFPSTTSQDHAQKPSNATDFPRERQRTESDVSSASQSTTLASTSSRTNLVLASAPPTPVASSNSTPSSESTAKPNDAACDKSSTTSLPFEWANSSIPLPLPKGHTTILFFTLTNVPARDPDPAAKGDEDTLKHWEKGHLLLAVATSRVIYLYESRPSERRTWVLSNEFYAPATPRFISMVNSPSSLPSSSRNNTRNSPSPLLSNVSLVLGTRHETVLIRMADLSVRGIEILSKTRSRRSGSHRSTGSTSTSASSTRAAVASRVAAFVESKQGLIPAGMRGEDYGLAIGRRRPDGGGEESESADGGGGREEWVGCDELILPTRRCARASEGHLCRRLYLLTQGSSTAVVRSPLGAVEKEGGNVVDGPLPHRGGGPPPLHLRPIHTFHWPEPVSKVVVIFPDSALKAGLETHLIHVNLVGFSRTGIHVQEGTISIPFVEQLAHPDRSPPLPASSPSTTHFIHNTTFFHPIRQHKLPPLAKEAMPADVDPELDDTASLDFGRETAFLCASIGGEWGRGASSASPATSPVMGDSDDENDGGPTPVQPGKPAGLFFFTKAHADFPLKFLG
ncbi:hypothetical protein T439DRAFT_345077 [Meredithblackwellia eburnea MCA 4105]